MTGARWIWPFVALVSLLGCSSRDAPAAATTTPSTLPSVDSWMPGALDAIEATESALGSILTGVRNTDGLSCELALNEIARAENLIDDVPDRIIRTAVEDTLATIKSAASECAPGGRMFDSTLRGLIPAAEGLDPALRRILQLQRASDE